MGELKRNHRTIGRVVSDANGFTVLQTAPHAYTAAPSGELLPVTPRDAEFDLRMALAELVERATFLGVDVGRLRELLDDEIKAAPTT